MQVQFDFAPGGGFITARGVQAVAGFKQGPHFFHQRRVVLGAIQRRQQQPPDVILNFDGGVELRGDAVLALNLPARQGADRRSFADPAGEGRQAGAKTNRPHAVQLQQKGAQFAARVGAPGLNAGGGEFGARPREQFSEWQRS